MKAVILMAVMLCAGNILLAQRTDTLVIHFDFDKAFINPASAATLDSFFANRISGVEQLEMYGHCDYIGNHVYNDQLSRRRIAKTRDYLIDLGIKGNIIVKDEGFGKRKPLNENRTPEERLENRRVELVVHWMKPDTAVVITDITKPKPPATLTEIIKDSTTKSGTNIILRNLQFQGGRHFLLPESQPILDELLKVMIDNPGLVIEIQGHVCCTADNVDGLDIDFQTYDLSVQRARAIYTYLVNNGVATGRLTYRGFGGSRKLYPLERDEFERQENRRVELRIVRR